MNTKEFNNCLKKIHAKDKKSLEKFYIQYSGQIKGAAYIIVKDNSILEDILDEFMIKLTELNCDYIQYPKSWLYRTVVNFAKDYIKNNREIPTDFDQFQDALVDPSFEKTESDVNFFIIIRHLNETEQKIFTLRFLYEYKHREIAEELNIPLGTVLSTYKRVLNKLKELFYKMQ